TLTSTVNDAISNIDVTEPNVAGAITLSFTNQAPAEGVSRLSYTTLFRSEKDAGEVENSATVTGTPPFDPADPTQPGEPIDPVPRTPEPTTDLQSRDHLVSPVLQEKTDPALSFPKTGVLSADGNNTEYTFT